MVPFYFRDWLNKIGTKDPQVLFFRFWLDQVGFDLVTCRSLVRIQFQQLLGR